MRTETTISSPNTVTITSPPPNTLTTHSRREKKTLPVKPPSPTSINESKITRQLLRSGKDGSGARALKFALLVFLISGGSGLLAAKFNPTYLKGYQLVLGMMFCLWLVSVAMKNVSIVDPFWGLGFVFLAWFYRYLHHGAFLPEAEETDDRSGFQLKRGTWVTLLASLWGLRLFFHLLNRNWGEPEDSRYQTFRRLFGKNRYWWFSGIQTYLFQGTLMWWISYPLFVAQGGDDQPLWSNFNDWLGTALWVIGFYFETVGDYQLSQFRKDPANKGKLLSSGLWSRTRHPNYFGDACVWWGLFTIASSVPRGSLSIFSPILMTALLRFVSGVPLLEKGLKESKKPGLAEYLKNTNAFFPRIFGRE